MTPTRLRENSPVYSGEKTLAGGFKEISFGDEPLKPVVISLPYYDYNDDGIVDGTRPPVHRSDLRILSYTGSGWEELPGRLDYETKRAIFEASSSSVFVLAGKGLVTLGNPFVYPNPSGHGGTSFMYELAEDSEVTIKVYTVASRLVRVVLDGEPRSAGVHEDPWDGCAGDMSEVANGSYYFKISALSGNGKSVMKTGKLTIMR